ncbi:hypothetical protein COU57_05380 [Candidatus Pacearchaeota archaeon CG10_big_fil_rev_8_21_14_0_10_32_14]|nr:MAG: hypothetical protein COU57_05380 [Candidatus Pacearchaeota archaeon CG10_big_fil_rev_8_21_14_0_10_32_14]
MKTYYPPRGLRKYYFGKFYLILFLIMVVCLILLLVIYFDEIKLFAKSKGIFKDKLKKCNERWNCDDWGACSLSFQNRTCQDLNACGTSLYEPPKQRSCINKA